MTFGLGDPEMDPERRALTLRDGRQRAFLSAALAIWCAALIAVSTMVAHAPTKRTVTHLYHDASAHWWAGEGLYSGPYGMNYLPHFALLFAPFHALPVPVGDIAWRWFSGAVLVLGLWRLSRRLNRARSSEWFFWASILSVMGCLGAIRNGQATTLLAGLFMNAASSLMLGRWWSAALLLALAVAVKPLGVVMLLLVPIAYRPALWRTAIALMLVTVAPFCFAHHQYVMAQFAAAWQNLSQCAALHEHRFADLNGIFRTIGAELPDRLMRVIALMAALLIAGILWKARRTCEPWRGFLLLSLSVSYLMLFNPMNESNSYVMLAPVAAAIATHCLQSGERRAGWAMAALALSLGVLAEPLRRVAPDFSLWWKPLMAIVFLATMMWLVFGRLARAHSQKIAKGKPTPEPAQARPLPSTP